MHPWLARLRHDLVKRALWAARDLADAGTPPGPADREALRRGLDDLIDAEGQPVTARELWQRFRLEAPAAVSPADLDAFEHALARADQAVRGEAPDEALAAVLALEPAFTELARRLES